jgi:hypothetical protein
MKAPFYVSVSAGIFLASIMGWVVLLVFVPDRLNPTDPPLTLCDHVFQIVGLILVLPTLPLNLLVGLVHPRGDDMSWILGCNLASGVLWSCLIVRARRFWRKRNPEPVAAPL